MPIKPPQSVNRRTLLRMMGASAPLAFAGSYRSAARTGEIQDTETEDDEPAPTGTDLSNDEVAALVDAFDSEPMRGGQDTPKHVFKWITDDSFLFLHFNAEDPLEADYLEYLGVGVKGVFTKEDQPDEEFTHFHQADSESWDAGHGGDAGEEGYWLTHVAATEFEAPWGDVTPGVDYDFMPTPPPDHDGETTADFEIDDQGPLEGDDLTRLVELFDDEPIRGGQDTPKHVWKWVNEEVFMFLHLDEPDVAESQNVDYFGIGARGDFSAESQPHPDFTHFHQWSAESWDAGHGGDPGQQGYWLIHVAAREHEEPWGEVEIGVDREFMPTPPPSVEDEGENGDEPMTVIETTSTDDEGAPFAFDPDELEITVGETVQWVNTHDVFHTVTSTESLEELTPSGLFDQSLGSEGETFEVTFEKPGTYHYYCKPHTPFMTGTVHVEE